MKFSFSRTLSSSTEILLLILVFLFPVFFLPWSLDVLEINKQTLLVVLTAVTTLVWVGNVLHHKGAILKRGWLNLLPLIVFAAVFISTLFSTGNFVSWIGTSTQEYQSLLTIGALTILFYVITHTVTNEPREKRMFLTLLASGSVVLLLALLNIFGASIFPWEFLQGASFNTIGTVNALGMFGVVMSIFGNALWLVSGRTQRDVLFPGLRGKLEKALVIFISLATLLILLALDFWVLWAALILGTLALFIFGLARAKEFPQTNRFILPMIMAVLSVFFIFLPKPFALDLPVEIMPTAAATWDIAEETLKKHSVLFGSGPGTFIFDYAQFRGTSVNQTAFWDTRFDRGNSYALTSVATGGLIGVMAMLFLILVVLIASVKKLLTEQNHEIWKMYFVLFSTWLTLVFGGMLYSWNMTFQFLFYLFTALIIAQLLRTQTVKLNSSPRVGLMFSFVFVVFSIAMLTIFFVTIQRHVAENAFADAVRLDRSRVSIDDVLQKLDRAATMNRYNDIYYRNLSQALLFKLSDVISTREAELTADQTQFVQALTSASVNSAKRATDLSPYNILNWSMRGQVYRELMPLLQDSEKFAILSYERAVDLEPNNPSHVVNLARTHHVAASLAARLVGSSDAALSKTAEEKQVSSLAESERLLRRAIELKGDYAVAHYYLALTLQDQGRLEEAFDKLVSVRQFNPLDVGVAFQLGQLAMRMERNDVAKAQFENAISLAPNYSNARWFLATVYEIEGDIDAAIEQIQFIKDINPENSLVTARLNRLLDGKVASAIPAPLDGSIADVEKPQGE